MKPERLHDATPISPDEWELVKDLVFSCQSLDREAREPWLDKHCPPGRLRQEVDRLLKNEPTTVSFLETSAPAQMLGVARPFPSRIGRFQVTHQLGVGGMGVVYAAVDERLARRVALKVLQPDAVDEEHRRRLLWDARAASVLNHPNIVCVYEAGAERGIDYVAMELVSGRTLAEVLETDPPPQAKLIGYAIQIAAALEAAHAVGIVHRDLKPSNVMITDSGVAKLMDFGLAKSAGPALVDASAPPTLEGRLAGTVAYMSPEQAEGGELDFRSDIFSFGSLLYEMLTLRRAFSGGSAVSVLAKIIHAEPPHANAILPALDPRLEEIVGRCLRKNRERRFQSMAEVKVRLQEVLEEATGAAAPLAVVGQRRPPVMTFAAVALLAAATGFGAYRWLRPTETVAPAPVLSRLTWDGGLTTSPAISPDATLLAYASDRAGRGDLDIWVQRMGGSDPIRLTSDPADDSRPTFSPDGTRVAYRSERDGGGVYVAPSLGGTERLLVPGCRDPEYSPDGRTIACWMGDVGGAFYPGTARIALVPATGGQPRAFRPDFASAAFPLWTPDGKALIFLGRKAPVTAGASIVDWWTAPEGADGERATGALRLFSESHLVAPEGLFWIRPEAWFDGGRRLLFTARHVDATNIWSVEVDDRAALSGPPRPMTIGAAVQVSPKAATKSDLSSFAFASLTVDVQLRRLPLWAEASRGGAPERLLPTLSQIGSPSISADGRLLVFSARQPDGYRIVSVDTATSEQRTVTTVESSEFVRTIVSGDGTHIVYSANGANRVGYRMAIRRGVPEPICERCGWPTHVNVNGTEAIFESAGSDERLLLWSGGKTRPLLAEPDAENRMQFGGRFSPDGRWIAFCAGSRTSPDRQIIVVPNAPDRALRPDEWIAISDRSTSDREPYWSPDGRRVYFLSDRDGFRCIWARPLDPRTARPTGPAYPVAHFHHARELLRAPTASAGAIGLSASRDSLIFTVASSSGNIWWQTHASAR
jgi:eukaryotic-like serine/threonine-protein kinase